MNPVNDTSRSRPNFDTDLVLYYHPQSYYSQKILFALYEKNLKFSAYEVDVANGEQYASWFLDLNPKGEVPVLQYGTLVVPESGRILQYLEDNFKDGNNVQLYPKKLDTKILERILYFHRKISRLPVGAISLGSFIHTELCLNPKPPFIGLTRKSFIQTDERVSVLLETFAKFDPAHSDLLLRKAKFQEMKRALISDRSEYMGLINAVDFIISEVETELIKHDSPHAWLCGGQLTIADISLALLLHRLNCLGMEEYFWKNKRPIIEKYFQRISQRESFQKALPSTYSTVKQVWSKTPSSYKYSAAALSAAVILSGLMAQRL